MQEIIQYYFWYRKSGLKPYEAWKRAIWFSEYVE